MPDWTKSMIQTFDYYIVDPATWKNDRKINNVISCTINRDSDAETLGSATIDISEDIDECYIRAQLTTIQNGVEEHHVLDTFLVQTPNSSFNGKYKTLSADAYTPLLELKENAPPLGYSIPKDYNIMEYASLLTDEHLRAPVVKAVSDEKLSSDFVANVDDKWLSFISDLISNAKFELGLDELGRVLFLPKQDIASLQPVWTYDENNSSILYPDVSMEQDLYDIPNVIEVIYSSSNGYLYGRAVNDDSNSPTSTVNRGREIVERISDPDLAGNATSAQIQEYAEQTLRDRSAVECSVTYSHGYCPVRLNDCVRLNYPSFGLVNIKAKVVSQSIECTPGCKVTEKAVYTKELWG